MPVDDFNKRVIEESSKSLFNLVWSTLEGLGKKAIDEYKVRAALERYAENYVRRHGLVKVLGMTEPIPLLDIYTSVNIVYPEYLYKEKEIDLLEQDFRIFRTHSAQYRETFLGAEIANEKARLNILGAPGSGKSTFLKRIGLETLLKMNYHSFNEKEIGVVYKHDCIPVLIELRRFRNEALDLVTLIADEFSIAGFPDSKSFVERTLKNGRFLILLDGIDEVPKSILTKVIEHLRDFTNKFSQNRFITSCRTAFYKTYLENFTDVEIATFNDRQVATFIQNWFRQEKDVEAKTADRFIEQLFDQSNRSALELGRTPLLLTFLCLTFDESQRFPANRSNLYRRALLILLERWAAEKRIHNEDIFQDLTSELEIEMLSVIASKFFKEDKIFFYESELKEAVKSFLESLLDIKFIPISQIVEAIEVQQGLLVQRAPEIYSFSHLTIQEYLTAHFYYNPQMQPVLVETQLFNEKWREVFLLLAGIGNADQLLILILSELKKIIEKDDVLRVTLEWAGNLLPKSDDVETDTLRRVFLISLILRFKRYDFDGFNREERKETYADALLIALNPSFQRWVKLKENISTKDAVTILEIISKWGYTASNFGEIKQRILSHYPVLPLGKMLNGSRQKFRNEILKDLYNGLDVPSELGFLPKKRYNSITKYLEACVLLVDCKNSALRVSKDVWRDVISTIGKSPLS